MTNLAENQKDQQIARQAAEIEALNRKVENLEMALQKCLDPDTGEINPALNFRSGEPALLQKIKALEGKLSDCLEPGSQLVRSDRVEQRIEDIISASFLPVLRYNLQRQEHEPESQPWSYFREFLFNSELFSDQWARREFRLGVDMLNDLCQATDATGPLTKEHLEHFDLARRLFGGGAEWIEKKKIAADELTASLLVIIDNYERVAETYVSLDDLHDMLATLKLLSFCQRLWAEAKEPEPARK